MFDHFLGLELKWLRNINSFQHFGPNTTLPSNQQQHNPANICWSWRRLQHVFSVTILRLPRRLARTPWRRLGRRKIVTLKTPWRHVLKTSWRDVLKMSWRHVLKTSWRHYGDKQNTYWGYLYLTNLNVYLTNPYLTNLHLTILRRIQNALSRAHHFNICLILELKQHLYSRIKISDDVWCCEISWIKIRHCKKGEAIKTNF